MALLLPLLASCAAPPPYRTLLYSDANCEATYARATWNEKLGDRNSDAETARIQKIIRADRRTQEWSSCWESASEHHAAYDLYTVEFDDEGWLASPPGGTSGNTTLSLLMQGLRKLAQGSGAESPQPLSIIVYTHGWHHTAAPDDDNVIAFRRLLEQSAYAERDLCLAARGIKPASAESTATLCTESEAVAVWRKRRHVVGIYVGWRGDSTLGLLQYTSIWDRKLAAETVALGSIQELFARIHSFYIEHECHDDRSRRRDARDLEHCADVRLLTVGHSFGGLVTYRALAPRITLGIVETETDDLKKTNQLAYGFGDLTVLVNPAFEGTRFESVAEAAASRQYLGPDSKRNAQPPLLIVATSETDWATHYAFPIFRAFTTLFEDPHGPERGANLRTVGWTPRYRTHRLTLSKGTDKCGLTDQSSLSERLAAEATWSQEQQNELYKGFGASTLDLCDSLELSQTSGWALTRPAYLPVWVIQADRAVINGHNDFLNVHFVDFVRQVYYTILQEEDSALKQSIQSQ